MDAESTPPPTHTSGPSRQNAPRVKSPRVPKPPPPPLPKTRYTYVTTEAALTKAVRVLSRQDTIVLDCEGHALGMPGGAPSILSLGTLRATHVYLLDLLALRNRAHPAFSALLVLLVNTGITKVVWDGRADMLELRETLRVDVGPVLDLQLVEAVAPYAARTPAAERKRRKALAMGYLKRLKDQIEAAPERFDAVYAIKGLDYCLGWYQVCKVGKDPTVVALHQQGEEDPTRPQLWMQRPLPKLLLDYAARDVELIGRVYTAFETRGYLKTKRVPPLVAQSARYVRAWKTREYHARQTELHLYSFVPLNVLDSPGPGTTTYECQTCGTLVGAAGFERRVDPGGNLRSSSCRLCVVVKLREDPAAAIDWVGGL